jgi:hypothetical protein
MTSIEDVINQQRLERTDDLVVDHSPGRRGSPDWLAQGGSAGRAVTLPATSDSNEKKNTAFRYPRDFPIQNIGRL